MCYTGAVMPGLRRYQVTEGHRSLGLAVLRSPSLARRSSSGDDAREVGGGDAAEDAVGSGAEAEVKSLVRGATL